MTAHNQRQPNIFTSISKLMDSKYLPVKHILLYSTGLAWNSSLHIAKGEIPRSPATTFLWKILDEGTSWKAHTDSIVLRCKKKV